MNSKYLGNLHEMVMTTPTQYWNDSCLGGRADLCH